MLEYALIGAAALLALAFRPWSTLGAPALRNAWIAAAILLACLWAAQQVALPANVPLVLSGACLLVLMFGWPVAVLTLVAIGAASAMLTGIDGHRAVALVAWNGIVPASAGLGVGLATRRWLPRHLFVYILARGFAGTALAMTASAVLAAWWTPLPPGGDPVVVLTAGWLSAWGEAFATGALTAIFVAFRPDWLATYSDARYLPAP